jgi:hypothetical protein
VQYTEIAVSVERKVPDPNYGNETVSVRLAADLERGDDSMEVVAMMLTQARTRVDASLRQSPNAHIQRAAPELRQLEPIH